MNVLVIRMSEPPSPSKPCIIVHGGAGSISSSRSDVEVLCVMKAVEEAAQTGYQVLLAVSYNIRDQRSSPKPGFHIVVSVVRKKFIGQIQLYGNLPYKCSIQKKLQIQLVVRDRINSICPMNFFRATDPTDTTIWKPGFTLTKANENLRDS